MAKSYRRTVKDYGLSQEFTTPYTPEQNGIVERVIRALREECIWPHNFRNRAEAEWVIARWVRKYNTERPHESLGWETPSNGGRLTNKPHSCPKSAGTVQESIGSPINIPQKTRNQVLRSQAHK